MRNTEKLIDAFGELIYVIAMADGSIQPEEMSVIEKRLSEHPWGKSIKWSFDYEVKKDGNIEDLYKKVISYCELHGPEKEYQFLIDIVKDVAEASAGIDKDEQQVMDSFVFDLTRKFIADIDRINKRKKGRFGE